MNGLIFLVHKIRLKLNTRILNLKERALYRAHEFNPL